MGNSFRIALRQLRRANELHADKMGLLDRDKILSGAPLDFRLVIEDEIAALQSANIQYLPLRNISGSKLGWVHPDVYDLIVIFEENEGYSDITLSEWLIKTYVPDSD